MSVGIRARARIVLCALLLSHGVAQAHETRLPLDDGKFSSEPRRGYIMPCDSRFPGGGGAHRVGEWIRNGYWDAARKPTVDGDVAWPNAAITVNVEGTRRVVHANNLPKHNSGEFPIRPGTTAYQYDRNPNRIRDQQILLTLPANPSLAENPSCVPMGMIGFALSGVPIFNALDLLGRDAPAYEIQDQCNGHPEPSGQYHYHDWSPCLTNDDADAPVGWMLDGFPILGPVDARGKAFTNADLDECHGRIGTVKIGVARWRCITIDSRASTRTRSAVFAECAFDSFAIGSCDRVI